ncbi:MAG TPA: glycoside hydrolase family 172 protein [Verrucomicrobiae bacterium]|nr:glycoside hydrolase family 172 protein [Verrucomicrobiae bacterium]
MKKITNLIKPGLISVSLFLMALPVWADESFGTSLGGLSMVDTQAESRSISAENFTGAKGQGGMAIHGISQFAAAELGQTWKVSPAVGIGPHSTFDLADISGPGCINHIWMTPSGDWSAIMIRIYWDGETNAAVECPLGAFFASGWNKYSQINSLPVCVNPGSGLNCYWSMPFRKRAHITIENKADAGILLFYQVDYTLAKVPKNAGYFHARFHSETPLKSPGTYTILDNVRGEGQYVGTYIAIKVHNSGWWGEGEIKFFMDGDDKFPTICGTGTEDYFCGSYDFHNYATGKYQKFSTPYSGLAQVLPPDQIYQPEQCFGLYRWHITDPIRFHKELKVTIQDLGWKSDKHYRLLQDDISSVAFWYQK